MALAFTADLHHRQRPAPLSLLEPADVPLSRHGAQPFILACLAAGDGTLGHPSAFVGHASSVTKTKKSRRFGLSASPCLTYKLAYNSIVKFVINHKNSVYNLSMNYHRYYDAGESIFITQIVKDRKPAFQNPASVQLLLTTFEEVNKFHPFTTLAYVILPDHFHFLIKPTGQSNFSQIMHSLKSNFTKSYKQAFNIQGSLTFWQRRFWDHIIRDEIDLENHIHYIHFNPSKHGYIQDSADWVYSSFNVWQARGAYSLNMHWKEPEHQSWGE